MISFIGRSSAPQGPITISSVSGGSCRLDWHPPKDDGGSKIINYLVQKCDINDKEWTNVTRVCRNTSINVSGLKLGGTCNFRVKAKNSAGVMSEPLESKQLTITKPSGRSK